MKVRTAFDILAFVVTAFAWGMLCASVIGGTLGTLFSAAGGWLLGSLAYKYFHG